MEAMTEKNKQLPTFIDSLKDPLQAILDERYKESNQYKLYHKTQHQINQAELIDFEGLVNSGKFNNLELDLFILFNLSLIINDPAPFKAYSMVSNIPSDWQSAIFGPLMEAVNKKDGKTISNVGSKLADHIIILLSTEGKYLKSSVLDALINIFKTHHRTLSEISGGSVLDKLCSGWATGFFIKKAITYQTGQKYGSVKSTVGSIWQNLVEPFKPERNASGQLTIFWVAQQISETVKAEREVSADHEIQQQSDKSLSAHELDACSSEHSPEYMSDQSDETSPQSTTDLDCRHESFDGSDEIRPQTQLVVRQGPETREAFIRAHMVYVIAESCQRNAQLPRFGPFNKLAGTIGQNQTMLNGLVRSYVSQMVFKKLADRRFAANERNQSRETRLQLATNAVTRQGVIGLFKPDFKSGNDSSVKNDVEPQITNSSMSKQRDRTNKVQRFFNELGRVLYNVFMFIPALVNGMVKAFQGVNADESKSCQQTSQKTCRLDTYNGRFGYGFWSLLYTSDTSGLTCS